jgi:hypothetical protein
LSFVNGGASTLSVDDSWSRRRAKSLRHSEVYETHEDALFALNRHELEVSSAGACRA